MIMDIDSIIQNLIVFTRENVIVAVITGLTIIYLMFRQLKLLLSIVVFLLTAYGVAQLFERLSKMGLN